MASDSISALDDTLARLQQERERVVPQLRAATGVDAEQLARALKMLDDKIAQVTTQRHALVQRRERVGRLHTLRREMQALVEQVAVAEKNQGDAALVQALQQRLAEVRAEATALLSTKM